MALVHSLSLCSRLTLDLHNLNNEGTEGNQQMTRMVWVVVKDGNGKPTLRNVNAISGDMFKHIQAEHLHRLAVERNKVNPAEFPLSNGALLFDANRINSASDKLESGFWGQFEQIIETKLSEELDKDERKKELGAIKDEKDKKKKVAEIRKDVIKKQGLSKSNTQLLDEILKACAVTDLEGTLVTAEVTGENRSIARKSCVEFGWVVGLPDLTRSDTLFHVKYDPGERGEGAGAETPQQAIFHRPLNSGVYAAIAHVELYRIGRNDITLKYAVNDDGRKLRAKALVESLWYTFLETSGAQRNTQHPHVLGLEGILAYSTSLPVPAPTASPLDDDYQAQIEGAQVALNKLHPGAVTVMKFRDQTQFSCLMVSLIEQLEVAPTAEPNR